MLLLSNTEYAITINIIEYINTTYSHIVSFNAYVFFLKIFSLTSRVRLSVKKVLGYSADTKHVPLRTLKISLYTSFTVEEGFLPNKEQRRKSLKRLCVPFVRLGNTQHICLQWCRVHLHGEILGIRTCADVTRLSNSAFQHLPLIYTLLYSPKTYLLQDHFMIIIIIQLSKVWINEHLCNFTT